MKHEVRRRIYKPAKHAATRKIILQYPVTMKSPGMSSKVAFGLAGMAKDKHEGNIIPIVHMS